MLKIEKLNNSVYVEGVNHALWPYDAAVAYPFNSLIVELDESDIATFHSAANYDVVFSGKISDITIEGETVTKDNICEKFGAVSNVSQGGGGGLTPEQEQKLNNAVQTDTYNADKEAQAHVDENQDAAINGKANADLDNIDKEALKKIIQGGTTYMALDASPHIITADEAAQKWEVNYSVEAFDIWGDFGFELDGSNDMRLGHDGDTTSFSGFANSDKIAVYDKATNEPVVKTPNFTLPDGSFYIKFTEGASFTSMYIDNIKNVFYSGSEPMFTETDPVWNAEKGNYYTKTESDGKYQPKGNYPTFTEMQASLNGKADKTTTYTKTQVDTALSGKTNTDLDNISDAGKDNLKKMIQGGNAQIENGQVITANEAAMKWTIDFDDLVDVHLTKGDDWYGVLFVVDGTRLNVYGDGGHEGLIRLFEKDTDEERTIYDGEGYAPVELDNYYLKITEGYTLTYTSGSGKLVSHQPSMIEETDPVYTADKPNIATKEELNGYVDSETYEYHLTEQTAKDNVQDGWLGDLETKKVNNDTFNTEISRIDSKINDIELYKFPNATIIGEPVIQSGQVSGFSTTNYLQFPFILDLRNKPFQIDFVFTTGADVATQQNVLDSKFGIAVAIKDGKGLMAISSNGETWNVGNVQGTMAIEPNTTYYAQLIWNGTQYKTMLSTDGVTYAEDMVLAGTERPYPTTIYIGGCDLPETLHTPHPFLGSINLNKAHLKVNGTIVWDGMDDVGLASRLATDMNNIDAAGIRKVKEIAGEAFYTKAEIDAMFGYINNALANLIGSN